MTKRMLIDASHPEETRVVITNNKQIEEFDFVTSARSQIKGNIYLAKVTRVEPSLQAAFVDYGAEKQGFLSFSEIHPDYYQIPVADRKRLLEEQERQNQEEEEQEDDEEVGEEKRNARSRTHRRRRYGRNKASRVEDGESTTASDEIVDEADKDSTEESAEEADKKTSSSEESKDEVEQTQEAESKSGKESEREDLPAETPDTIETASEEEEIEQHRSKSTNFSKRYKIQEVIKRGQVVLVQVIKEERGNKGVSLTTYISLAGRYCVLMPNSSKGGGISRKIARHDERKRLREVASELKKSRGMSAIIRTAGVERTKAEIKRDYEYLIKLWNSIRENALSSTAPALVHEESNIMKRSIRDHYTPEIEEIQVQGEEAYRTAKNFMKMIMPSHAPRVKQYKETTPLFSEYKVESQLHDLYQPSARLKSGGYVVIDHTEALISIDVNSGRSTTERNVEETALKTNLEAAAEIARQLRLRDLGGLVVIDFIDMYYGKNRRNVERAFKEAMKSDRAKVQVGHISAFGLLELSRQRLRPSIGETITQTCPHCNGTGSIRSQESLAIEIIRTLEQEASTGQYREFRVIVNQSMALFLLNHSRDHFTVIEKEYGVKIAIKTDGEYLLSQYNLEKIRVSGKDKSSGSDQRRGRGGKKQNTRHSRSKHSNDEMEKQQENAVEDGIQEQKTDKRKGKPKGSRNQKKEDDVEQTSSSRNRKANNTRKLKSEAEQEKAAASEKDGSVEAKAKETKKEKPEKKKETSSAKSATSSSSVKTSKKDAENKEQVAKASESQIEEDPSKPKRSGWWNRVVN